MRREVTELREYLTQHFCLVFRPTTPTGHTPLVVKTDNPNDTSSFEGSQSQDGLRWALSRCTVGKAPGHHNMPAQLFKCLGADSREQLRGSVSLVLKWGGDARKIQDHWPVTNVIYHLFVGVIKEWISASAEAKGLLTELKNSFR